MMNFAGIKFFFKDFNKLLELQKKKKVFGTSETHVSLENFTIFFLRKT